MTKTVKIGNVTIGGGNRVAVQSMTNTKTRDIDATVAQINELAAAGCDIVRASVPDRESGEAFAEIVRQISVPLVADIHFDYKLAVLAAQNGAAKIRINPGNIGGEDKVKYLADFLNERNIPIRIGVNGGSLDAKYAHMPDKGAAMCESALEHVRILEDVGFYNTVISVKSSDVRATVSAYRQLSAKCEYPLHLGVTEAGITEIGVIKSAIGIGALLLDGIGDTIRVSLTDSPVKEVGAAMTILDSIGMGGEHVEVVSCPTCARTDIDVEGIAREVVERTRGIRKSLKVAVMGCVVNGIGESKGAKLGVAGGKGRSALFRDGIVVTTVPNEEILPRLMAMIEEELR